MILFSNVGAQMLGLKCWGSNAGDRPAMGSSEHDRAERLTGKLPESPNQMAWHRSRAEAQGSHHGYRGRSFIFR